jgi:hypothetical protein
MRRPAILSVLVLLSVLRPTRFAFANDSFRVVPFEFDPHRTHLVAAEWRRGIGCPTNATTRPFLPPDFSTLGPPTPFSDPACETGGDPRDKGNQGLLLAKTGPTNDNASAGAVIKGVKGMMLTELGYDLRKAGDNTNDPRGSHCGAGAPRFNIVSQGKTFFIGCNSPPPNEDTPGVGWQRLRWGGSAPLLAFSATDPLCQPCDIREITVDRLSIVFDEGQDTGPDNFGLAVLDNIDVNGTLVGRGQNKPEDDDEDEGHGENSDRDHFQFKNSPSRPESSSMSFHDPSQGVKVQSVGGARAVTYSGACVSFLGDALVNEEPGYEATFAACDLSLLGLGIGNMSILVTGPLGPVYQKTNVPLTTGQVLIHPH